MNTYISWSWLGCVKFLPESQVSCSLCGEQCPAFKRPDSCFSSWDFSKILVWALLLKDRFFEAATGLWWPRVEQESQVWQNLCLAKEKVQGIGAWEGWTGRTSLLAGILTIQLNPCSVPMLQTIIFLRTWYFETHYMCLICLPSKRPSGRFGSDLLCPYWREGKQIIKPGIRPAIWMGSMRRKA